MPTAAPIAGARTAEAMLMAWPPDRPVAAIWGAPSEATDRTDTERGRWTIIAEPFATYRFEIGPDGRGRSAWIGGRPPIVFTHEPLVDLAAMLATTALGADGRHDGWVGLTHATTGPTSGYGAVPFVGGWIGYFSYDLGGLIEPAAGSRVDRGWPLIELHRCPSAWVFDRATGDSIAVGRPMALDGGTALLGGAEVQTPGGSPVPRGSRQRSRLGTAHSLTGRSDFEAGVARVIEYIRAGDVFQVNLAHRLSCPFSGSTRELFLDLAAATRPRHGAYLESPVGTGPRRAVLSMSPELFLDVARDTGEGALVTTRPMKGTRPATVPASELLTSDKDRAELNMIIDLMRNDLGRVCRFGSIAVPRARVLERHGGLAGGGVHQTVGTVTGRLRPGLGVVDLLRATFPGGSVTGAPKIRAMQIINELEPAARGPYCGAAGFISDCGHATLNIAIRTALVHGEGGAGALDHIDDGVLDYSVGAGIVADSHPDAEWHETLDKAGVLRAIGAKIDA